MFMDNRDELLAWLGEHGAAACSYTRPGATPEETIELWLTGRCDCKYGGIATGGQPRQKTGETTGCPEYRTMYKLLAAMGDRSYRELATQAGGVTHAQTHAILDLHTLSGQCVRGAHSACVFEVCGCRCHTQGQPMPDAKAALHIAHAALAAQAEADASLGGYAWEHLGDAWRDFGPVARALIAALEVPQ